MENDALAPIKQGLVAINIDMFQMGTESVTCINLNDHARVFADKPDRLRDRTGTNKADTHARAAITGLLTPA